MFGRFGMMLECFGMVSNGLGGLAMQDPHMGYCKFPETLVERLAICSCFMDVVFLTCSDYIRISDLDIPKASMFCGLRSALEISGRARKERPETSARSVRIGASFVKSVLIPMPPCSVFPPPSPASTRLSFRAVSQTRRLSEFVLGSFAWF